MEPSEKEKLFEALHNLRRTHSWGPAMDSLSRGEYFTLHMISHLTQAADESSPGAKITDLSHSTHMSRPAVSQMLNNLENKQLVERIMAKSDRRVVYVKLTQLGEDLLQKSHRQLHGWFDRVIDELGPKDTEELARLIMKLYTIMENLRTHQ